MIQFAKPQNLNGSQLVDELKTAGIEVADFPMLDSDENLFLDIDAKDKTKALKIIEKHVGNLIPREQTIDEKLASVGLSVDDLKAALGI